MKTLIDEQIKNIEQKLRSSGYKIALLVLTRDDYGEALSDNKQRKPEFRSDQLDLYVLRISETPEHRQNQGVEFIAHRIIKKGVQPTKKGQPLG